MYKYYVIIFFIILLVKMIPDDICSSKVVTMLSVRIFKLKSSPGVLHFISWMSIYSVVI